MTKKALFLVILSLSKGPQSNGSITKKYFFWPFRVSAEGGFHN